MLGDSPNFFVYNVHRWYEPPTGRYTRPDPLSSLRSSNLYSYANANPTRLLDSLGLAVATVGCTSSQTAQIQSAAAQADGASATCLPCEDREPFRNKIRNLTVKCIQARYTPLTGTPICGKAFGYSDGGEEV